VPVWQEGPLIETFMCLPTEAEDDSGMPHVTEHLVFQGSKKFPFWESMNQYAPMCLASTPNAWTATDHTCYFFDTVNVHGFNRIAAMYLDHVLRPLLEPHNFVTEIHHVNDKGEDGGVVFSEMKVIRKVDRPMIICMHDPTGQKYFLVRQGLSIDAEGLVPR